MHLVGSLTVLQGELLAALCLHFKWDRVSVVYTTSSYGSSIAETFTNQAASFGIRFLSSQSFPTSSALDSEVLTSAIASTIRAGPKIVFLAMNRVDGQHFFLRALEMGLSGPNSNVNFIGSDGISQNSLFFYNGSINTNIILSAKGLIGLVPRAAQGPEFDAFSKRWYHELDPAMYPGAGAPFGFYAPFLYDSVYAVAYAMDRMIRNGISIEGNGDILLAEIRQKTMFHGLTGLVFFDERGDRLPVYEILNLVTHQNLTKSSFEIVGYALNTSVNFTTAPIFSDNTTDVPDSAYRIYVNYSNPRGVAMVVLCCIGILCTIVFLGIILFHHETSLVRISSPRFIVLISVGILLGYCNVFVWTGEPSDAICQSRPWVLLMGIAFVLGNLYAKSCRIYYLMGRETKSFVIKPIPDSTLFLAVGCYSILYFVPLIVWTVAYPLGARRLTNNPDNNKVNISCGGEHSDAFLIYFLVLCLMSIVFGVVLSFLMRKIHDFFSEVAYIGYALYTICITTAVVLPMLFILNDDPYGFYIVFILGCIFGNSAVLFFLFGWKVWILLLHPEKSRAPVDESGKLKTTRSRGTMGTAGSQSSQTF